jgi:hypothetical protein
MTRLLLASLLFSGCEWLLAESTTEGGLTTTRSSVTTGSSTGIAQIPVDVSGDTVGFLITATADTYVAVEGIYDPDGNAALYWEDWTGATSVTGAFAIEGDNTMVQWPIRKEDGDLDQGQWTVEVGAYEEQGGNLYYSPGETLDVTVQTKTDGDFGDGVVKVNIVYASGVSDEAEAVRGVELAVDRWNEIWAAYGLSVEVEYSDSNIDSDLDFPGYGMASDYAAESAKGENDDLTVIIGETIDGSTDYYGVAGGIPATLVSTERAVVVISWLCNSGIDAQFSDDDIRLFGETLAHEVGHYMGLFHPVEDGWQYWDALSDTDDCSSMNSCQSALGDNLMFPYPVCTAQACTPQDILTDAQQGVKHRYTGTL